MTELSSGTQRVKFGDVAINSTAVSAEPEAEGFDRYIIGKHIPVVADCIETWGPVGDSDFGPRIRTIFQPGDVICTTRGPNLKVARVDFRGLGAHTNFYLRTADPEVMLQPYLEAVVRSNGFQQHLVNNFRGSVNLFVNWSDAAKYEFALPPLEEQRRIVEVLQASEHMRLSRTHCIDRTKTLLTSILTSQILARQSTGPSLETPLGPIPQHWKLRELREVADFANGVAKPASAFGSGAPFVNLNDVFDQVLLSRVPEERVQVSDKELESLSLRKNDIIFVRSSVKPEGVAKTVLINDNFQGVVFSGFLIRCRITDPSLDPRFANLLFREQHFRRLALSRSTVSLNTNINQGQLGLLPVVVPPLEEQEKIVSVYYDALNAQTAIEARAKQDKELMSKILNHFLSKTEADA
jgi:type I restriction enzyme, S subunit